MINVFISIGPLHKRQRTIKPRKLLKMLWCGVVYGEGAVTWKCYISVRFITIRSNHYLWPLAHWGNGSLPCPLKYALAPRNQSSRHRRHAYKRWRTDFDVSLCHTHMVDVWLSVQLTKLSFNSEYVIPKHKVQGAFYPQSFFIMWNIPSCLIMKGKRTIV